ncbi:universal stress protein [Arenibacter sp. 6A1]|uniref:universal stress protein n=1 Tax=Arenibacter sp. 6A1 TaxID=2720391 RepID=UPI001447A806|nr:universal stress protein [Arenibacter sp. 6A1]NKI27163.1 universal stress protein [Arenibacter sp. 6A1]
MDKRILLPTDFSRNSLNAIIYALEFFQDQKCHFYILNAYLVNGYSIDDFRVPVPGNKAHQTAHNASQENLQKVLEKLKLHQNVHNHTFHTISTNNSLSYGVKNIITKKDIDLVIMGTKGATGAKTIIYGTNTVAIMEEVTECPVMSIPEEFKFSRPKEIVFTTNYKASFKRRELLRLIEIAKIHHTPIRVLHIMEDLELSSLQQNNKELLEGVLESLEHSFHHLSPINIHKGIGAFIESRGSDMVAFLNKKHHYFKSIFTNPLVKEIGYHADIPVLVLNDYT